MNIRFILFASAAVLLNIILCQAQEPDKRILMNIAGRDVEEGEFIRMYNKSLNPGNKDDLTTYIGQFIDFKIKVADAIDAGYDTTRAFRDELKGYRDQLAQNYLTDTDIKQKYLQKAYNRSLYEINASHILISCKSDAPPADTIKAYQKAMDLRERINKGEPFEQIARKESNDKSVSVNGGNLGYFSVFQMITPFEDAAYSLKPGILSMPVRSPFGYHLIKVNDVRPSRGKVKVAHIMIAAPPGSDEKKIAKAKEEIDSIYLKLETGASFSELAAKHSDHKESAARGGELDWFGAGEIPDFSEAAFSIKDTGEYTKPVRSVYGYHIIKLLGKKPPLSYEESKPYLESKINQSYLAALGKKSFTAKLKKDYNFKVNPHIHEWFVNHTDSLIMRGKAVYNLKKIPSGDIYSFADQHLKARDFAGMLEKKAKLVVADNPERFIDSSIESISTDQINVYENSILEKKYPDFRYLMNEFHDGILLFDISSEKVWNKVQQDTAGMLRYYNDHRNDFIQAKAGDSTTSSESGPLPFQAVQGEVISGYQDWLMDEWVKQLKKKYTVKIDNTVLEEVKRRLNYE
jgi:peptidyl-prolyl cis-trans isomerase SurA